MKTALSLKARLTLIILTPLLLIACGIGLWVYTNAERQAKDQFDRSLLSTALAISRDVALSGGDALSSTTRDLISDTSGGPVFYHVFAPDGVFVTGYATPPVAGAAPGAESETQRFFEAVYQGSAVRVLRLRDAMQIDGLTGDFTFTVWQDTQVRQALVRATLLQNGTVIAVLIASVGLIVWFGVGTGLRPLSDLEEAISLRTSDDLAPIQRRVPREVEGLVGTLNALLEQVSTTLETKNAFISNAAHQLRNPIAGILTMAEALQSAPNKDAVKERTSHLVEAAKQARDLANKMLTLERANAQPDRGGFEDLDLHDLLDATVTELVRTHPAWTVDLEPWTMDQAPAVSGDPIMLREAVTNLIDNAFVHGGPNVSRVDLSLTKVSGNYELRVCDDGGGIDPAQFGTALERFGQLQTGQGSGLGLPIALAVARQHGGRLSLANSPKGLCVTLILPPLVSDVVSVSDPE